MYFKVDLKKIMLLALEVSTDFISCIPQGAPRPLSSLPRLTDPRSLEPKESLGPGTQCRLVNTLGAPSLPRPCKALWAQKF